MDLKEIFQRTYDKNLKPVDVFNTVLADDICNIIVSLNDRCKGLMTFEISDMFSGMNDVSLIHRMTKDRDNTGSVTLRIKYEEGKGHLITLGLGLGMMNDKFYDLSKESDREALQVAIVEKIAERVAQKEMDKRQTAMMKAAFK